MLFASFRLNEIGFTFFQRKNAQGIAKKSAGNLEKRTLALRRSRLAWRIDSSATGESGDGGAPSPAYEAPALPEI